MALVELSSSAEMGVFLHSSTTSWTVLKLVVEGQKNERFMQTK